MTIIFVEEKYQTKIKPEPKVEFMTSKNSILSFYSKSNFWFANSFNFHLVFNHQNQNFNA